MLSFDLQNSAFLLDGCAIGLSSNLDEVARCLGARQAEIPDQPGWSVIKTSGRPINSSITFYQGLIHSGFFWAAVEGDDSWDQAEQTEAERRAKHENIMIGLFGGIYHDDTALTVQLLRDPRSYLEEIFFEFKSNKM